MKTEFDVCSVGHVSRDRIIIGDLVREQAGGAAYYASLALRLLGCNVAVVTKMAAGDGPCLCDELLANGIDLHRSESPATTAFENIYSGDQLVDRVQRVSSVAAPFVPEDLEGVNARFYHLGPITAEEMTLDFLRAVGARGAIGLDAQGLVRRRVGNQIEATAWLEMEEGLAGVQILKANLAEAQILSGEVAPEAAALRLAKLVALGDGEVVVTLGSEGALICRRGRIHHVPALVPARIEDVTGAGDTFFAAYIQQRLNHIGVEAAGRFACAAATLAIQHFGASTASSLDVDSALSRLVPA